MLTYEWQAGCCVSGGVEGGHTDDVLAGVIITVAVILLPVISHTLLLPSDNTFKALLKVKIGSRCRNDSNSKWQKIKMSIPSKPSFA